MHPSLKELAIKILTSFFEDFKLKRFDNLERNLNISRETLKKVIELIQHLNPKPGEGEFSAQENYITPDFIVEKDNGDFLITLNDRNIPSLRINNAYKQLVAPKGKKVSAETKDFVKKKFEAAKWFIASIHQRRETLMKVMKIIVEKQRQWFEEGEVAEADDLQRHFRSRRRGYFYDQPRRQQQICADRIRCSFPAIFLYLRAGIR